MTIRARSSGSSLLSIAHEATPSTRWVGSSRNAVLAVEDFIPRYSASSSQKPESATEVGAPSVPWGTLRLLKDLTSLGPPRECSYTRRGIFLLVSAPRHVSDDSCYGLFSFHTSVTLSTHAITTTAYCQHRLTNIACLPTH